jgi:hypothetical protein
MLIMYPGNPPAGSGVCQSYQIATNTSTGVYYICNVSAGVNSGSWMQLGGVQSVVVAPSGSCTNGASPQMVIGTGVLYTCQGGTWGIITASSLNGATFAAPGAIGGGTPGSGAFTTISASGQITSTVSTGTPPLVIASTTQVTNLNAQLHGGLAAPASAILGLTDTQAPTNKTFDISANTLKNSSNTAGHVPRNNGTQYTDAQLGFSDLNGTAATSQIGTGTPGAGKYVDGATGAWTALPGGSYNGSSPNGTYNVTSDQTISSSTLAAISGLSWTMPANAATVSSFSCHITYSQTTNAQADAFGIQDVSVAPTNLMAKGQAYISASAFTAGNVTGLASTTATNIVAFTPSAPTTVWNADFDGTVEQPSNASSSVVQIMALTGNVSNALVIKRGSYCRVF